MSSDPPSPQRPDGEPDSPQGPGEEPGFPQRPGEEPEDELDGSPLAKRLRHMTWPEAPTDVKQRVLERILAEHPRIEPPCDEDPEASADTG